MNVFLQICVCTTCTHRNQKGASDLLKLDLQIVVSHHDHTVLRTKPGSTVRATVLLTTKPSPQSPNFSKVILKQAGWGLSG